jgi:site-specific recombinase XerD
MSRLNLTLDQTIDGFLLHCQSKRLSRHTIRNYRYALDKLLTHVPGTTPLGDITVRDVSAALATYTDLSKKTMSNVHAALSAMWNWAVRQEYADENPLERIDRPKPEKRTIVPLTADEIKALLKSCAQTRAYTRPGKRACTNSRPTAVRDRAIILTLLDTGLRASELCNLTIADYNQRRNRISVFGKGSKERTIPISTQTAEAIWEYLATRNKATTLMDEPLFTTSTGRSLDRHQLRRLLVRLADAAGVEDVHPHKFRHTFAIFYLRNEGDIYSLQEILGHSTLDMVKNYLTIAQTDIDKAHKRASPVANMRL